MACGTGLTLSSAMNSSLAIAYETKITQDMYKPNTNNNNNNYNNNLNNTFYDRSQITLSKFKQQPGVGHAPADALLSLSGGRLLLPLLLLLLLLLLMLRC
ncbi:unnamed protein product [Polarella glacialis]|uniref:Uncharacterized protein n=1 Tax=Polarella glacialis TaxID=89957 RepID=A0A813EWT3_POLGL|nr:unnamed protein product [Polarella glacialis]